MVSISLLCTELKCKEQQVSRLDLREDVFLPIPIKKSQCLFLKWRSCWMDVGLLSLDHISQDTPLKEFVVVT